MQDLDGAPSFQGETGKPGPPGRDGTSGKDGERGGPGVPVCILGEPVVGLSWGRVSSWLGRSWGGRDRVMKRLNSSHCSSTGVTRSAWPCWT